MALNWKELRPWSEEYSKDYPYMEFADIPVLGKGATLTVVGPSTDHPQCWWAYFDAPAADASSMGSWPLVATGSIEAQQEAVARVKSLLQDTLKSLE